jgi:hypothetical protein
VIKGSTDELRSSVKPAAPPRLDWRMGQAAAAAHGTESLNQDRTESLNQLSFPSAGNPPPQGTDMSVRCIALHCSRSRRHAVSLFRCIFLLYLYRLLPTRPLLVRFQPLVFYYQINVSVYERQRALSPAGTNLTADRWSETNSVMSVHMSWVALPSVPLFILYL